jgi:hypothetical protein
MRTRRAGFSVTELLAATTLMLMMTAALFPPPRAEAAAVIDVLENESARLLLEGELTLLRQEVARGELQAGVWRREPTRWAAARQLRGLELQATATALEDGVLELTVEASWRPSSATSDPRERRALRLGALATPGRAP